MDIKNVSIYDIAPYEDNPRKNEDAVQVVMNSIKEFGIKQPLVLDENNVIVVGHTRFEAAKRLGYKEVPCVIASDLTEEQITAYRLADNKTNEYSKWDMQLLSGELALITNIDMEMFGFDLEVDEEQKKKDTKAEIPFTEVLGEEHNYIVLYFDNEVDWLQIQSILDLKEVRNLSTRKDGVVRSNMHRVGIGRGMKGNVAMEKLREHYENVH